MTEFPNISQPDEIKNYSQAELIALAELCRQYILENVSHTGGHLASNLGVVELVLSIARVFDFSAGQDRLIFDVGHQCYVWKLISGRAPAFPTLRQKSGLSGFPKRSESPWDFYDAGHSSDSVSIALGYQRADRIKGESRQNIAFIGDGGLTGGIAYEALNDAGQAQDPIKVILNDNQMSIDKNLGGLTLHLERLRTSDPYLKLKSELGRHLEDGGGVKVAVRRFIEEKKRNLRLRLHKGSSYFESIGFRYYGPVDGHDWKALQQSLKALKASPYPAILHVITEKGRGYEWAVEEPAKYHGVSPFKTEQGVIKTTKKAMTYSDIVAQTLPQLGGADGRVCAITAAMAQGTGLYSFAQAYPERFFDTAIAEQHAVSLSAGLALGGLRPYVALYSTFSQRAVDQILHDVLLENLPVCFLLDRAGLVGNDGETHQGLYDIALFKNLPNLEIFAPADAQDLKALLFLSLQLEHPVMLRYPKAEALEKISLDTRDPYKMRKACDGEDALIIACGSTLDSALGAQALLEKSHVQAGIYSVISLKALEDSQLEELACSGKPWLLVEESVQGGGFSQEIITAALALNPALHYKILQVQDPLQGQASRADLLAAEKLDAPGIAAELKDLLK